MLIGLAIRDVVLIESLDLSFGPGLTALTGETGAGKSIILDALGLAMGARGDAALVRAGAAQATASAIFAPPPDHPAWAFLDEKGLAYARDEDLVLRRSLGSDGRSRAFVNDQATGVGVLRDLAGLMIEVHGQHDTSGLLDARTHRTLLDAVGGCEREAAACLETWSAWRAAREAADLLAADQARAAADLDDLAACLAQLDALAPREGEEATLADERSLLGVAEKTLADIAAARGHLEDDDVVVRLGQALRALERARERISRAGAGEGNPDARRIALAAQAVERALIETTEAVAAIDLAAQAFDPEPDRLEKVEERLFALRAMARRLAVTVDRLPGERADMAARLMGIESGEAALAEARTRSALARISASNFNSTITPSLAHSRRNDARHLPKKLGELRMRSRNLG